ncbi:glycosyltransferase 87 family protein [Intrasporangium sp. YIM S08009]|uniref:glycosyltransferase 87 family protein n=1 Tax=Intrasporangium zincisolvens TaxID=3080018 RepID=UPI002B0613B8|nr:glycosyltransferase 87 family protein [Intrasporangium sp. YIM S08009]
MRALLTRSVVAALVAVMLWQTWGGIRKGIWVDTDVYRMGGQLIREGGDLYSAASNVNLPFTYSPFAGAVFVPFSFVDVNAGRYLFTALSLACFALIVFVVARRLRLSAWQTTAVVAVGFAMEPMLRDLLLGQINLVLMALVVVDWLVVPPKYRGFLTGIAAGIKVTPAAFVLLAVLRRDWATVARSAVGFLATGLVGWLVAPAASATYWGGAFLGLDRFGNVALIGSDNQSLVACWMRLTRSLEAPTWVTVVCFVVGLGLGVTAAWLEIRVQRPGHEVASMAWLALGALLASPVSWTHHWLWMIVVIAVLLARGKAVRASIATVLVWFPTVWLLNPLEYAKLQYSTAMAVASCVYAALAVTLLVMAVRDLAGRDAGFAGSVEEPRSVVMPEPAAKG